jgi:hypothetical protein
MTLLRVDIVGFADESFPGFVHCAFVDANGKRHTLIEKEPVVSNVHLWTDSSYPQPGMVLCESVERLQDGSNRDLALVSICMKDSIGFAVLFGRVRRARIPVIE